MTGWLRHSRLVTLLGPGGVGKTRLAIGAADAAQPQFAAGVWFVDLAPLSAPSLVPEAVAKALGIGDEAGRSPEERLVEALSSASLLLVLDNCEHVLDACAALSSCLLSACPHLRVLATSRQALGVPGEQVYTVPSLRLPPRERIGPQADPGHAEKNVLALLEYEAVRLFVERATQTSPTFRLNRRNAEAVVEICHHLDGIPLALELAAARVRSLSPQEIGARLGDRLRLLVSGNRAAAPRHQTLRAAIDWSYSLLSAPERSLLHRLSVFAGGWRLEAAEAVCAGVTAGGQESIEQREVLDLLTGLTEKSLVAAEITGEGTGEATRYRLQETVRQYARERLRESGEEQAVREQHRDEFLRLTARAKPEMQGPGQTAWLDRLESEHDNLRAALDWCLEEPDGAQPGLRLASDLFFLWWIRGYFAEGQRRYAAVLGRTGAEARTPARAKALSRAGGLLSVHGDAASARPLFEEGLAIARELGDRKAEANLLCNLGDISIDSDPPAARAFLEQSLAAHREIGNPSGIAHASMLLGNVALRQESRAEAQALYAESLSLSRVLGNPQKTGHALWCLARGGMGQGDYAQARVLLEECVTLFRALKDPWGLSAALALAGEAALQEAEYARAHPLLAEHLRLVTQMGMRRSAPWVLRCLGRLAAGRKEWARVTRVFGAADTFQGNGAPLSPTESSALTAARAALGESAFAAAWSAGKVLSLEQAAAAAAGDG